MFLPDHHCAVRRLLIGPHLIHALWLELITSALVCTEIALHICHATKDDGLLTCLSLLKLNTALQENNLFPFLLDMKESYFDILLLMLFLLFECGYSLDLVFIPAFDALCAFICVVCICHCL